MNALVQNSVWGNRAAAIGLLLLAALIVYLVGLQPLVDARMAIGDELARTVARRDRLATLVDQEDAIEQAFSALASGDIDSELYLPDRTYDLAAARFQGLLLGQVQEVGGRINRSTILPYDDARPARVAIRLQFQSSHAALVTMLAASRLSEPLQLVDQITIRNAGGLRREGTGLLSVDVEMVAFRLQGANNEGQERP